jgi:hypothetical protein
MKGSLKTAAIEAGLKTKWKCWAKGSCWSEESALLEICKRIECIESCLEDVERWVYNDGED